MGRSPQATAREFARSVSAVADFGLREQEEPNLINPGAIQVVPLGTAGGLFAVLHALPGLDRMRYPAVAES